MDLHPYDGAERRFRHTDADRAAGLALAARLLGLPEGAVGEGARYDLSLYSGGLGVIDLLAITIPADEETWRAAESKLGAVPPEGADPAWREELAWLLDVEEGEDLRAAAASFVNQRRRDFQPACVPAGRLRIARGSGVNSWATLWGDAQTLSYLAFDQG